MKATEKIVELIENGDPIPLLAEASLVDSFNELLRFQLIDIVEDKVKLTPKGEEAKIIGLDEVLVQLKTEEELEDLFIEKQQEEGKILRTFLWLLLFALALFLIYSYLNNGLTP